MTRKPMSQNDSQLPVPVGTVTDHSAEVRTRKGARGAIDPAVEVQRLGEGEKRGLKGGSETLSRAKTTYLKSEYSGPNDRRPRAGLITRKEI